MPFLNRKKLHYYLENVEPFKNPKLELEQYCTSAQISDSDAVNDFNENLEVCNLVNEGIDITLCDVTKLWGRNKRKFCDTVILNPPFGIDMEFLEIALSMAKLHVYSLHKSVTRKHVLRFAEAKGAQANVVAELRFNIPRSYKKHRFESVDIAVDLVHSWF